MSGFECLFHIRHCYYGGQNKKPERGAHRQLQRKEMSNRHNKINKTTKSTQSSSTGKMQSVSCILTNSCFVFTLSKYAGCPCCKITNTPTGDKGALLKPTIPVPKKEILLILPYLGLQSKIITKQLKACINKFYGVFGLRVIFQSNHRIKSLFPHKDRLNRSQMSNVV